MDDKKWIMHYSEHDGSSHAIFPFLLTKREVDLLRIAFETVGTVKKVGVVEVTVFAGNPYDKK